MLTNFFLLILASFLSLGCVSISIVGAVLFVASSHAERTSPVVYVLIVVGFVIMLPCVYLGYELFTAYVTPILDTVF